MFIKIEPRIDRKKPMILNNNKRPFETNFGFVCDADLRANRENTITAQSNPFPTDVCLVRSEFYERDELFVFCPKQEFQP